MDFKDTANQQRFTNKAGMFTDSEKGLMKSLSAGSILENYSSDLLSKRSYGPKADPSHMQENSPVMDKFSNSTLSESSFKSDEREFRGESSASFKSSMEFVEAADQKAVESARAKAVDSALNDPHSPIVGNDKARSSFARQRMSHGDEQSSFIEQPSSGQVLTSEQHQLFTEEPHTPFLNTERSEAEMASRIEQFQIHMTDTSDQSPLQSYGNDVIRQYTAQAENLFQGDKYPENVHAASVSGFKEEGSQFAGREAVFKESGADFLDTPHKGAQFIANERDLFEGYGGIDAVDRMYGINARWSGTNTAGGARFFTSRDDAGNYTSQVFLKKGAEKAREESVRKKAVSAFQTGRYVVDLVGPEENETAASNVDDKASKILDGVAGLRRSEAGRYHQLGLEKNEQIKNIDRYISVMEYRQAEDSAAIQFAKSNYSFQDSNKEFVDKAFGAFRVDGMNHKGEELFLSPVSNDEQLLQAGVFAAGSAVVGSKFSTEEGIQDEAFSVDPHRAFGSTGSDLSVGRFSDTKELSDGNKNLRSVESRFSDRHSDIAEKKELRKEKKAEKNALSKEEKKALRKAAAIAAVSRVLKFKRDTQNMLGDMSGQVSDDLMAEGTKGLLRSMIDAFKSFMFDKLKSLLAGLIKWLGGMIMPIMLPLFFAMAMFFLFSTFILTVGTVFWEGSTPDAPAGDGYTFSSLSAEQIEEIVNNVYLAYGYNRDNDDPDRDYVHEDMMRYALTKVGCTYDQAYHWSLTANIYDCSSLAYRTYRSLGIDVSRGGYYCAADEYKHAVESGHAMSGGELMPGDLIFYGGKNNGRYMGVYHVAIYIGNGKMVEARGTKSGVVYCDYRNKNVVGYARYI